MSPHSEFASSQGGMPSGMAIETADPPIGTADAGTFGADDQPYKGQHREQSRKGGQQLHRAETLISGTIWEAAPEI